MTPKEKAIELMDKMSMINGHKNIYYKQCALIMSNEILNFYNSSLKLDEFSYWLEVIKKIEEL